MQRGHVVFEAGAQRRWLTQPFSQRVGAQKMEKLARARCRVAAIGEADDLAGGLEQKRQRRAVFAPFEGGAGVALGLALGGDQVGGRIVALGLNHADGSAVDKQHVIRRAAVGRVFAHRHTDARTQIERLQVLQHPAGLRQLRVDGLAGFGLGGHARSPGSKSGAAAHGMVGRIIRGRSAGMLRTIK